MSSYVDGRRSLHFLGPNSDGYATEAVFNLNGASSSRRPNGGFRVFHLEDNQSDRDSADDTSSVDWFGRMRNLALHKRVEVNP
jgi:hypothetical protein